MDYKNAGVDIEAGYKSVELMKKHIAKTMRPEVLGGIGGFSGAEKTIIYCVASRLEMSKIKETVKNIDPTAFMSVVDVHETYGIRMGKRIDKI